MLTIANITNEFASLIGSFIKKRTNIVVIEARTNNKQKYIPARMFCRRIMEESLYLLRKKLLLLSL